MSERQSALARRTPASSLRDSLYRGGIGFNIGVVAPQSRKDLLRGDTAKVLAQQNGLFYRAFRPPGTMPPITAKLLAAQG